MPCSLLRRYCLQCNARRSQSTVAAFSNAQQPCPIGYILMRLASLTLLKKGTTYANNVRAVKHNFAKLSIICLSASKNPTLCTFFAPVAESIQSNSRNKGFTRLSDTKVAGFSFCGFSRYVCSILRVLSTTQRGRWAVCGEYRDRTWEKI